MTAPQFDYSNIPPGATSPAAVGFVGSGPGQPKSPASSSKPHTGGQGKQSHDLGKL